MSNLQNWMVNASAFAMPSLTPKDKTSESEETKANRQKALEKEARLYFRELQAKYKNKRRKR